MVNEKKVNSTENLKNEDLDKIKIGLRKHANLIIGLLNKKVNNGNWELRDIDFKINEGHDSIDLVFFAPDKKKGYYVLVDLSIPHLHVGQTYDLPKKANFFQKEQKVALRRIKKAIILIRKGTETLATRPSRIRCPILEIQLEDLVRPEKKKNIEKHEKKQDVVSNKSLSHDLLNALKSAIVHESLSTMNKRKNKYIRRGLWKWIEREIMDVNVHFYLIILSGIYQGRTGDLLSRKFQTTNDFLDNPEDVISVIFSKDNNLADEIKKKSERHKKALRKFLACFSQTPPFEYLRSLFLKEFRSGGDSLKARMSVYSTLKQLLERCGFEGEKEVRYPLEVLDELAIFQGIMAGDYSELRINNAIKKLKRLIPDFPWDDEAVYNLRNQLAKILKLPPQEFNLNAFLPQAFNHDARQWAEKSNEVRSNTASSKDSNERNSRKYISDETNKKSDSPKQQKEIKTTKPRQELESGNVIDHNSRHKQKNEQKPNNSRAQDNRDNSKSRAYDEGIHRFFENFGGHLEEDIDSIRLALAMDRYEQERLIRLAARKNEEKSTEEELEEDDLFVPPTKRKVKATHLPVEPPKKNKLSNRQQRQNNQKKSKSNRNSTRRTSARTSGNRTKR